MLLDMPQSIPMSAVRIDLKAGAAPLIALRAAEASAKPNQTAIWGTGLRSAVISGAWQTNTLATGI